MDGASRDCLCGRHIVFCAGTGYLSAQTFRVMRSNERSRACFDAAKFAREAGENIEPV